MAYVVSYPIDNVYSSFVFSFTSLPHLVLAVFQHFVIIGQHSNLYKYNVLSQVAINIVLQDEKEFLDHIIKSTNMNYLTPL